MICAACRVLVALATTAPSAEFELSWHAPPGCPGAEVVRDKAAALVAPAAGDVHVSASARVDRVEGRYRLELRITDRARTDERTLHSTSCERLADAAALVVSVALDPVAVAEAVVVQKPSTLSERLTVGRRRIAESRATDRPTPPPATVATPVRPPQRVKTPRRIGAAVRTDFGVSGGVLPSAGAGVALAVAIRGRLPWRAEVTGAYFLRRTQTLASQDAGGRLWSASAGVRGCGEPELAQVVTFPLCAGVDVGGIAGEGFGVGISTRRDADVWAAAVGAAGITWAPVPAFALSARADVLAPFRRPGFHIDEIGPIHRVAPVAGRGWLGVELRFE